MRSAPIRSYAVWAVALAFAATPVFADVLADKELKKAGAVYAVDGDPALAKEMASLAEAKKKLATDAKGRKAIEKSIADAKGFIGQAEFELRKMNEEMAKSADIGGQNRKIAAMNAMVAKRNEAVQYRDTQEKKLAALGDDARSEYIGVVLKLEQKVLKVEKQYADLAADADVTKALEELKPKGKLGPTPAFIAAAREIKKLRADIEAENIEVTMENQIPWVDVTLNGTNTRRMVFDTGASIIAIPFEMAKAMELVSAPNDAPILRMQLADGKVVEAKQMILKSVRVGSFEVKDVEAAILPESLAAAAPLLGGSYLRHFIHRLDRGKGELSLARVGAEGSGAKGASTTKKPDAAPKPDAAKPDADAGAAKN